MRRLIGIGLAVGLMAGFLGAPVWAADEHEKPEQTQAKADRRDFDSPLDAVWQSAMAVFNGGALATTNRILEIDKFDKASGMIISKEIVLGDGTIFGNASGSVNFQKMAEKPEGGFFTSFTSGRFKVTAYFRAIDDKKTNVKIVPEFAMMETLTTKGWVRSKKSKGVLEKEVLDLIAADL